MKEALKLALEALEEPKDHIAKHRRLEAINAIKEALAQPEQEPVAFINVEQRKLEWAKYTSWATPTVVNLPKIPLYTKPPQRTWVDLTDEEIISMRHLRDWTAGWTDITYTRAIEAKLKEKNT